MISACCSLSLFLSGQARDRRSLRRWQASLRKMNMGLAGWQHVGAVRATYLLEEQPGGVFHYHDTPSSKELLQPPGTGCPGNRAPKTAGERMRAARIRTAHQPVGFLQSTVSD